MNPFYPVLDEAIYKRGVKRKAIAQKLGISERAFRNKMLGKTEFSWSQACYIQSHFFPDIPKDELFKTEMQKDTA